MALVFVFGGCCANALTLQQLTDSSSDIGALVTFTQFSFVSLVSFFFNVRYRPYPSLRPRRIPLLSYLFQVALFYLVSLLNNAAFAYRIPVSVHIIFRSGGLVTGMLLGRLIAKKRYPWPRIFAVILVTLGVCLSTTSNSTSDSTHGSADPYVYAKGVGILIIALFLSSYLGLVQEREMAAHQTAKASDNSSLAPPHLESLFYLHVLALPMFLPLASSIRSQFTSLGLRQSSTAHPLLGIPSAYVPLALNTVTQLVCVTGVHRLLTSSYSVLTVNLVLVIRKVVSLILSVLMEGNWWQPKLWVGASLVTLGTILYGMGGQSPKSLKHETEKEKSS